MHRPGVQANHTMEELVEDTLESKSSELYQNILSIIDSMLHPPPSQSNDSHPTQQDMSTKSTVNEVSLLQGSAQSLGTTSSTFELPIDLLELPGLSTNTKQDLSKKSNRQKTKPSENVSKESNKKISSTSTSVKETIKKQALVTSNNEQSKESETVRPAKSKHNDDINTAITSEEKSEKKENVLKETLEEDAVKDAVKETIKEGSNFEVVAMTTGVSDDVENKETSESDEREEKVFDEEPAVTSPKVMVRRSARLASRGNGETIERKRKNSEENEKRNKRKKDNDTTSSNLTTSHKRRTIISTSSEDYQSTAALDIEEDDNNSLSRDIHTTLVSKRQKLSTANKQSQSQIVTRSNRQVKSNSNRYCQQHSEESDNGIEERELERAEDPDEIEKQTSYKRSKKIAKIAFLKIKTTSSLLHYYIASHNNNYKLN